MNLGVIGLGRIGGNIARRLKRAGHRCVVYDAAAKVVQALGGEGAQPAGSVEAMEQRPRTVWVMLPAGRITEETITASRTLLKRDDILIDGGSTYSKGDVRRGKALADSGIRYVDAGTPGGVCGLERGYCLMVGGENSACEAIEPIFETLAYGLGNVPRTENRDGHDPRAEKAYLHAGPCGAGDFVKVAHNGIEYGVLQAFAEDFDILRNRGSGKPPDRERFDFALADIAELWRRSGVVSSWLLDLSPQVLARDEKLEKFEGTVEDSGEGRWAIEAAIEEAVPADGLFAALFVRCRFRQQHTFAEKMLSAMRFCFSGHVEKPA